MVDDGARVMMDSAVAKIKQKFYVASRSTPLKPKSSLGANSLLSTYYTSFKNYYSYLVVNRRQRAL
jgi:hypothetical protein